MTSPARRLSGAPPLECTSSRARPHLERAPFRARRLSSASPLFPARRTPTLTSARRKRPVRFADNSVRWLLPEHLRPRKASRHRGEGPFRVHAHHQPPRALARLSCDTRGYQLLCDRTPLRARARHKSTQLTSPHKPFGETHARPLGQLHRCLQHSLYSGRRSKNFWRRSRTIAPSYLF